MKTLADNFTLDSESQSERQRHEQQRRLEVELAHNVRAVLAPPERHERVVLNPLEEALKGAGYGGKE